MASPNATNINNKLAELELLVVCDAFLNETCENAHVVLPIAQFGEEEGTMTNLEGRVILRQRVRPPPSGVRTDIEILCALSQRLGVERGFSFASAEAVFDELRLATRGGKADYSGIDYDKIRTSQGVFWPCPAPDHPGTPRLFAERFAFPSGRARFHAVPYRPAAEVPDDDYPLYFTTGATRSTTTAARRRGWSRRCVTPSPNPCCRSTHAWQPVSVSCKASSSWSRVGAGSVSFAVRISADIRPDTLFAPFHWGGRQAANLLTIPALDPLSRMPEFKVCAVRARAANAIPKGLS